LLGHVGEGEATCLACGAKPLTQGWHWGFELASS
jgi:hypothetical protein